MSESAVESKPPAGAPRGSLAIIFFIVLMDLLGFGIIIPLLMFYVPEYQAHPMEVTALFSVYSICQFIGAPILGLISDRYGRRPVLTISQAGSAVGYILLGVAAFHWQPATRLLLVYISRVIDGFTGGNISTAQAYVSDVTTPENRAKGMGMLGAAFGVGFSLGPAMGGIVGHYFGLSAPGWVAAALAAGAATVSWIRLPESLTHAHTEAENWLHPSRFAPILRNAALVQLLAIGFCIMAAFVMMESTISLFLNKMFGWKELGVGLYFLFIGIVIIAVQGGMIGRLTRKFGDWPLCTIGPFGVAVGMGGLVAVAFAAPALGFAVGMAILLAAGAVNAFGRSFQQPTLSSLLSKFSDRSQQGAVFGLYHGLGSLARVLGPVLAGFCYPFIRNTGQFLLAGMIAIAMGVWTYTVWQPTPHEAQTEAASEAALERG